MALLRSTSYEAQARAIPSFDLRSLLSLTKHQDEQKKESHSYMGPNRNIV